MLRFKLVLRDKKTEIVLLFEHVWRRRYLYKHIGRGNVKFPVSMWAHGFILEETHLPKTFAMLYVNMDWMMRRPTANNFLADNLILT